MEAAFFTEAAFLKGAVLLGGMALPREGWATIGTTLATSGAIRAGSGSATVNKKNKHK